MRSHDFDIAIIGGGIVGAATAYQLQRKYKDLRIAIIEKENALAQHQSGHNSGVIHSGIYYKPGSHKAKNCIEGHALLLSFLKENNIAHSMCGKIITATREDEFANLETIYQRGLANRTPGIKLIDQAEIKKIEPHCAGIRGIWVPSAGIVDYHKVTRQLLRQTISANVKSKLFLNHQVTGMMQYDDGVTVKTKKAVFRVAKVIVCGGLQADRLAHLDGLSSGVKVVPFRGDFFKLTAKAARKVNGLIYPVPDPKFPFLGVHFTRMIAGGVECGPNAVFSLKREGYGKFDFSFRDTFESLAFKGTRKFFAKHWRYGLTEYRRALSKRRFLESLQRLIPNLDLADIEPARAGLRAMMLTEEGLMLDDFRIDVKGNCIHVLNAPSPAATASLAIGARVAKIFSDNFD